MPDLSDLDIDCQIRHPAPEGGGFEEHLLDRFSRAGLKFYLMSVTSLAVYPSRAMLYQIAKRFSSIGDVSMTNAGIV